VFRPGPYGLAVIHRLPVELAKRLTEAVRRALQSLFPGQVRWPIPTARRAVPQPVPIRQGRR